MKLAQYTKSLTVALRPEVYKKIKAITDEKRISMADFVRAAVDDAIVTIEQYEDSHH
jgi:hypothetical protein